MSTLHTIKGFADLYAPESTLYTLMEDTARKVFGAYGYTELRTPIMEFTELFSRSIGNETDVVQKEMYTFPDRKNRSLTLRPEATAGIMRSYIEHKCHAKQDISKFFTYGPMFRYERPQKGRMRQFHQLNCECLGGLEPQVDAEVILMLMFFMKKIGLDDLGLELNTLGCRTCRPGYREKLGTFLSTLDVDKLCEDCRRRLSTNPMRVLDCKVATCQAMTADAPQIRDNVCSDCSQHFDKVLSLIDKCRLPYVLNPRLVRGLDYYTRTTFEVVSTSIGSQGSVAGGGRYDGLVNQLGGPDVPGIGFAIGMERLALMLQNKDVGQNQRPDFFFAALDDTAVDRALLACQTLREAGLSGELSFSARSMKSLLRQATRTRAEYCLMLGEQELAQDKVIIKHMDSGDQVSIHLYTLADWAEIRYDDKQQKVRKGSPKTS